MNVILLALLTMGGIGLAFAVVLLLAYKKLAVEEDPRIKRIEEVLPGANCGACGYPGCAAYAEAIVNENAPIDKCGPGGAEVARRIAEILGIEGVEVGVRKVAHVMCQGTNEAALNRSIYYGISTCRAAHFTVGGDKECYWGCLGLGDCVRACPFDAIHMTDKGIPIVDRQKCTGCGLCVEACPRNIIELVPITQKVFVLCKNEDKGANARKYCDYACIGCRICVRKAPEGSMEIRNNLAVILDHKPVDENAQAVTEKCPTKSIVQLVDDEGNYHLPPALEGAEIVPIKS
ncbi:MAG: electron transporter RnfB [Candidatus Hydrothermota bacterium]|nr:MAG: electron transporter RnfB [Candidatus Hydrothermae bacterium]